MQNPVKDLVRHVAFEGRVDCEARHAHGAHQHGADQETPNHQIGEKEPLDWLSEMLYAALEQRRARGKLPTGKSFVEHELQKRSQEDCPKDRQTEHAPGERRRRQIPGSDAGRGDQDSWSNRRE